MKNVSIDCIYPVCKVHNETIFLALVLYLVAQKCWQYTLPGVVCADMVEFAQWWEAVFEVCDKDRCVEVATIWWALWKARNDLVWNNKYTRTNVVIASEKQYLVQWKTAQKSSTNTLYPNMVEGNWAVVWAQTDKIKISVNGTTFAEYQSSGIEMLAGEHAGELLTARTIQVYGLMFAEMIKAMASKEALSWIKQENWQQVVVESDCLVVVHVIRSNVPMVSQFGRVVEECRQLLLESNMSSVLFIKWSTNMAAHELVRVSYIFPDQFFYGSSIPIGVKSVILAKAR